MLSKGFTRDNVARVLGNNSPELEAQIRTSWPEVPQVVKDTGAVATEMSVLLIREAIDTL